MCSEHVVHISLLQQVPFEVLVRRQIARLLDPSLQCARFIYDELVKVTPWHIVLHYACCDVSFCGQPVVIRPRRGFPCTAIVFLATKIKEACYLISIHVCPVFSQLLLD
jgi:hypothetical protein